MIAQFLLQFDPPNLNPKSLCAVVKEIMLLNEWCTLYFLQAEVQRKTGERHSDSTVSARVRDLRKLKYGGYVIERRPKENSDSWEYKITGRQM